MKFYLGLFLSSLLLFSVSTRAEDQKFQHVVTEDLTTKDVLGNFGVIYATQWAVYYLTQREIIEDHGSWQNFLRNPFSPHFDKDSFDYNLIKHTISGHYYYLFFRSRGYTEKNAFLWSFASSLAFEFAVETVTERPSLQDIYQTPVYGTLLGMGLERLSNYFHSHEHWAMRGMGYLLNPFTILPYSTYRLQPQVAKGTYGLSLSMEF